MDFSNIGWVIVFVLVFAGFVYLAVQRGKNPPTGGNGGESSR